MRGEMLSEIEPMQESTVPSRKRKADEFTFDADVCFEHQHKKPHMMSFKDAAIRQDLADVKKMIALLRAGKMIPCPHNDVTTALGNAFWIAAIKGNIQIMKAILNESEISFEFISHAYTIGLFHNNLILEFLACYDNVLPGEHIALGLLKFAATKQYEDVRFMLTQTPHSFSSNILHYALHFCDNCSEDLTRLITEKIALADSERDPQNLLPLVNKLIANYPSSKCRPILINIKEVLENPPFELISEIEQPMEVDLGRLKIR